MSDDRPPLQRSFDAVVPRVVPVIVAACRVAVAIDDALVGLFRKVAQ